MTATLDSPLANLQTRAFIDGAFVDAADALELANRTDSYTQLKTTWISLK